MKAKVIKVDTYTSDTFQLLRDADNGIHLQLITAGMRNREHWDLLHKKYKLSKKHRYLYDYDTKTIYDRGEVA